MLSKIQIIKRNKVKALIIKATCAQKEIPATLGTAYGKIAGYMTTEGAMPAGAPFVAYLNQDMDALQLEIGIPVAMYVPDTDEIKMSEIPEGDYVQTIYTGPYTGLYEAYGQMTAYMTENNKSVKGAVYESYLNDPGDTEEEKLETEILFKI